MNKFMWIPIINCIIFLCWAGYNMYKEWTLDELKDRLFVGWLLSFPISIFIIGAYFGVKYGVFT